MRRETSPPGHTPGRSTTEREGVTFKTIYDEHERWVWSMVRRLGVPERSRPDAVQEVFMVVHRRLPEYQPRDRLRGWLGAIVAKMAATFRRRESRKMEPIDEENRSDTQPLVAAVDVEGEIETADELQLLLDELDPDQRFLLLQHHQDDVPLDEIAEYQGVPVGTIKKRLWRAREDFKAAWRRQKARERQAGVNVLPLFDPLTLLETDREPPPLPEGMHEKIWDGIQRCLGGDRGGDGGGSGGGGPASGPGPAQALVGALSGVLSGTALVAVGALVALVAACTFLLGLLIGLTWERVPAGPATQPATRPELVAQVLEPVPPVSITSTAAPTASAATPAATTAPSAATAADLENALMEKAEGALLEGKLDVALAAVQEHQARFHGGGLRAAERETLWITALLRAGRTREARERFARFEELYPTSPRLDPFRKALASP